MQVAQAGGTTREATPPGGLPAVAGSAAVAALGLAATALVLAVRARAVPGEELWFFVVDVAVALVYGVVGPVMLARRAHPVSWLLTLAAVGGALAALAFPWRTLFGPGEPIGLLQATAWIPGTVALVVVVPWLVDARPPSPAARVAVAAGGLVIAWLLVAQLTNPYPWPDGEPISPLAITSARWVAFLHGTDVWVWRAVVALGAVAAVAVARRWRTRPAAEARGLGWLAIGSGLMTVSFLPLTVSQAAVLAVLGPAFTPLVQLAAQAFFPVAALVVVLRQQLWGIDLAVRRTVVWGLLSSVLIVAYLGLVALVGLIAPVGEGAAGLAAAAVVAAGFPAARTQVQRRVDRLVYGDAAEPLRAVRHLGAAVSGAGGDVLPELLAGLATGLKLGSAVVEDPGGDVLAAAGEPGGEQVRVPLVHARRAVGALVVSAPPGERLDRRVRTALADVAPVIAATVHLAAVTAALRASRARIVVARQEERRVLRRELHDGLGPALAGTGLGLQAARNLLARDPAAADRLLASLQAEMEARVDDVRGLARTLLPPSLEELGLGVALQELAARYSDERLAVTVDLEGTGGEDAAVRGAAYQIAAEAVLNVRRHAGAARCAVRVRRDAGVLAVEVTDDGTGIAAAAPAGVGLQSMRERAEELGGTLVVGPAPGGGTRVRAEVPV